MDAIRKIIEHHSGSVTIELPEEYNNKKVEVIVLPVDEQKENVKPKPKYDFSKFFGKLQWQGDAVAEQRRLRDEWD